MASRSRNIYTGMTNSLLRRVAEHKSGKIEGFTKRYRIDRLVYYESFRYVGNAIHREKEIKGWDRARRVALIESVNPTWEDLAAEWYRVGGYGPDCVRAAQKSRSLASLVMTKHERPQKNDG